MASFQTEVLPPASIKDEPEAIFDLQWPSGTQCGIIFFAEDSKYTFVCQVCLQKFGDIQRFGAHWEAKHIRLPKDTPNCQEDENCPRHETSSLDSYHHRNDDVDTQEAMETSEVADLETIWDSDSDEYSNSEPGVTVKVPSQDYKKILNEMSVLNEGQCSRSNFQEPRYIDEELFCITCNRHYKSIHAFSCHKYRHNRNEIKYKRNNPTNLACDWCNEKFQTPVQRHEHEQGHSPDDHFQCSLCTKTFTTRASRRRHLAIHGESRPFACTLCTSTFRNISELKAHVREHLGDKPYACDYCDKRFTSSTNRNDHATIHTKEKAYECKECGKRFRLKCNLRQHSLTHESRRDFKCDQCGDAFVSNDRLKLHLVKHTDDKPYECPECMMAFKWRTTLKRHMKEHQAAQS